MLGIVVNGESLSRMQFNNSTAKAHHAFPKMIRFKERSPSFITELNNCSNKQVGVEKTHKFGNNLRFTAYVQKSESPGPGNYDFYDPSKKRTLSHGFGLSVR